jgi:hypothetical protein
MKCLRFQPPCSQPVMYLMSHISTYYLQSLRIQSAPGTSLVVITSNNCIYKTHVQICVFIFGCQNRCNSPTVIECQLHHSTMSTPFVIISLHAVALPLLRNSLHKPYIQADLQDLNMKNLRHQHCYASKTIRVQLLG